MIDKGYVTTADLNAMGYDHPPRAIADIKEAGIQVSKTMVSIDGRRMAKYELLGTLGDASLTGRRALPKAARDSLYMEWGYRCAVCNGKFSARELQADHRIPYRIAGESPELNLDDFMPLCPSCNRAKSWACENCPNWQTRIVEECQTCLWGSPQEYGHIAGVPERRLHVAWSGTSEVKSFDKLSNRALSSDMPVAELVKRILSEETNDR